MPFVLGVGNLLAIVPRFGDFRLPWLEPLSFQSREVGVGNFAIWSFRFRLRAGLSHRVAAPTRKSLACGVANFTASPSGGVDTFPTAYRVSHDSGFSELDFPARGVGHIPRLRALAGNLPRRRDLSLLESAASIQMRFRTCGAPTSSAFPRMRIEVVLH